MLNLLNLHNVATRSKFQLTSLLIRNSQTNFLKPFRSFQQSCYLCGRLWPSTRKDVRNRKLEQNQIQGLVSARAPRNGRVRNAGYCVMKASKPSSKENIWTIPNALCFVRIGMTPFIAYMIVQSQYGPAIGLLAVAGVTDLLDGWIARVVPGQSTVMGSFLDPMADKILVGTLFLSLTYMDLIPVPLTVLIVGRDAILIAAGFYIRYQSLDPPKTLSRYFNVTLPTAQLAPTFISKVNTGLQLTVVGATLASTVLSGYDLHPYLQILWYTTAATTICSAVYYCFAKDTVKLLRETSSKMKFRARKKID
ncbi:Cardiolipin synthase (CMP-forming) [Orchesella cincta]|uniref:cardiolipin synthase (CMP-forming) n=1 Tax=Orchesella cincta TaxID=48709 RepID=A0A1D2NAQ2_ORCCI|nr:Cardiolipin synthase (CMP-forming) [Orchesella cincta]